MPSFCWLVGNKRLSAESVLGSVIHAAFIKPEGGVGRGGCLSVHEPRRLLTLPDPRC